MWPADCHGCSQTVGYEIGRRLSGLLWTSEEQQFEERYEHSGFGKTIGLTLMAFCEHWPLARV
jgi:hypothetical protein